MLVGATRSFGRRLVSRMMMLLVRRGWLPRTGDVGNCDRDWTHARSPLILHLQ